VGTCARVHGRGLDDGGDLILDKVASAAACGTTLIIGEHPLAEDRTAPLFAGRQDIHLVSARGRERSESEYRDWIARRGFALQRSPCITWLRGDQPPCRQLAAIPFDLRFGARHRIGRLAVQTSPSRITPSTFLKARSFRLVTAINTP
jgi:hypothetical protein